MSTAMHDDARRLQGSAAFAFFVHASVLGLYLFSALSKSTLQAPVLHEVEFMDLKPAPVESPRAAPMQTAPRSLVDFLKMALPKPAAPQEAPSAAKDVLREMPPSSAKLLIDKGTLQRGPSLKIDSQRLDRTPSASLGEIARGNDARQPASDSLPAPKTIALDAVGRRAAAPAGPAIRIEGTAGPVRAGMRDLPSSPRGAAVGTGLAAAPSGLDLREGAAPVRRATGFPGGGPSIGYSKGSGISLAEGPVGRPKAAALPAAPPPAEPRPSSDIASAGSKKAVEIAGPLAGRKILSMSLPAYPEWAKARGIEADVLIRFFVGPEGRVQERMIIERTSGHKELDDLCMEALQKIIFAPLPAGSKEEQWGIITFRFRLT
ncbi:MAG: TonB family protein [Elusimicrobia bacterium]|nr:TonB family protein [Elusimicrobiota bacterium]